jgi:hypothetical protein
LGAVGEEREGRQSLGPTRPEVPRENGMGGWVGGGDKMRRG